MADWQIIDARKRGSRLYVALQKGETPLTVYLEAGEIAALGKQGLPLYDGKPKKGED